MLGIKTNLDEVRESHTETIEPINMEWVGGEGPDAKKRYESFDNVLKKYLFSDQAMPLVASLRSIFLSLFLQAVLAVASAQAGATETCALPQQEVLRLGCTAACWSAENQTLVEALSATAEAEGYALELVRMSSAADLKKLDGFISPGGHDIDPSFYNSQVSPKNKRKLAQLHRLTGNQDEAQLKKLGRLQEAKQLRKERSERDRLEHKIIKSYLENSEHAELPFLGVCYGMQMLGAASGIPLYVDLQKQLGIPARREADTIRLQPGHALQSYLELKANSLNVPKNHHQALDLNFIRRRKNFTRNIKVTATSNQGKIPEIIELKNRPALGVQFHAEESAFDETKSAPFKWLLEKACQKKVRSLQRSTSKTQATQNSQ